MYILEILLIIILVILLYRTSIIFRKIKIIFEEIKLLLNNLTKFQEEKISFEDKKMENSCSIEMEKNEESSIPTQTAPSTLQEEHNAVLENVETISTNISNKNENENEILESCIEGSSIQDSSEPNFETSWSLYSTEKTNKINYEKFIGENLFGKIGILIFVIGIGLFVKYAIDKNWINEVFRTVLGFLTGSALLFVAERLQKKYRTFSSLLAGGAFAIFYLTVAIAFHYYHLFSQTIAFIILIVLTIFMSTLSILYNRRELAIISLIGGFIAPFIVSSGEGNYIVLFTYITILNIGMFVLSIYKKWVELPVISFVFTNLIMGIYLINSDYYKLPNVATHLLLFATLFYFIFLLPVIYILRVEVKKIIWVLVSVIVSNNFIYLGFGILFLKNMYLPFKAEGLLCLFIAIVNLSLIMWLKKSKQDRQLLIYSILGLVLTFVSITIPIQLNGNYITLFWASEMVLLLWLYLKSKIRLYEYFSFLLVLLSFISFFMDVERYSMEIMFLNTNFGTSLFMSLATFVFAMLLQHHRTFFSTTKILNYIPWNAIMLFASVLLFYYSFIREFYLHLQGSTKSSTILLFTSTTLLAVSYIFRKRFTIAKYIIFYILGMVLNVLVYIINIWGKQDNNMSWLPVLLLWCAVAVVIVHLYYISRQYYALSKHSQNFTIALNILVAFFWVTIIRSFLLQIGVDKFSSGLSISLSILGFVQMGLGMKLRQKLLRMISLVTFSIVLFKLIFIDLWSMATIGKILVFIMLGVILLVLSFLYQKLKDVLFKNDENEVD